MAPLRLLKTRCLYLLLLAVLFWQLFSLLMNIPVHYKNKAAGLVSHEQATQYLDNVYKNHDYIPITVSELCDNMIIYDNLFIHLRNAVINPQKAEIQTKMVHNFKTTDTELPNSPTRNVQLHSGFCCIKCNTEFDDHTMYQLYIPDNIQTWIKSVLTLDRQLVYHTTDPVFTVAVQRIDSRDLYVVIKEWYNIYLAACFIQHKGKCETHILYVDKYSCTNFDTELETMFDTIKRVSHLKQAKLYHNLVWIMSNSKSVINTELPLIESFRKYVFQRYGINLGSHYKDCQHLKILLIEPSRSFHRQENGTSSLERGISNGLEILRELNQRFPTHNFKMVRFNELSLKKQLLQISETNVLIGMHGTWLTHAVFLPWHSAVVELFPKDILTTNNKYKKICRLRGLFYISWQKAQSWNDKSEEGSTYIHANVVSALLQRMIYKICPRK